MHTCIYQRQDTNDGGRPNEEESDDDDNEFDRQMREQVRKRLRGEVDDEPKLSRTYVLSLSLYIYIYLYLHVSIYLSLTISLFLIVTSLCSFSHSNTHMAFLFRGQMIVMHLYNYMAQTHQEK